MIFVCGPYFSYDNPGAIEKALEKDLNITQTEYSFFYAAYSYPNTFMPILGGIFLDTIGIR